MPRFGSSAIKFFAAILFLGQILSAQISNFDACRYGYVTCDQSRLNADERARVAVAAHARNFDACRYGYATCDPSRLTPDEQSQVAVAAHARNFDACRYGYATCDPSRLTPDEQFQVTVAAHARNFDACRYGYATCDLSTLTTDEQGRIASQRTNNTSGTGSGTSLCAENGSCYGDLNANGVPKTVHVNGYYRKDGTYVRGHYRSAPGTNPRKR